MEALSEMRGIRLPRLAQPDVRQTAIAAQHIVDRRTRTVSFHFVTSISYERVISFLSLFTIAIVHHRAGHSVGAGFAEWVNAGPKHSQCAQPNLRIGIFSDRTLLC